MTIDNELQKCLQFRQKPDRKTPPIFLLYGWEGVKDAKGEACKGYTQFTLAPVILTQTPTQRNLGLHWCVGRRLLFLFKVGAPLPRGGWGGVRPPHPGRVGRMRKGARRRGGLPPVASREYVTKQIIRDPHLRDELEQALRAQGPVPPPSRPPVDMPSSPRATSTDQYYQ